MTTNKVYEIIKARLNNFNGHGNEDYTLGYQTALADVVRDMNGAIQREQSGEMVELGERNYTLIRQGVKTMGSYDPDEIFFMFEEELYMHEADTIYDFLKWVHEAPKQNLLGMQVSSRSFGSGNYEERFQEFLKEKVA